VAKTCREGIKSTMYTVVNNEPPWIDWKMPHIIGVMNVASGRRVYFLTLVRQIIGAHPQVNIRVSRRILCFRGGTSRSLYTLSIYSSSYNKLQEQEHRHENHTHRKIILTQTHSEQIIRPERSYTHKSSAHKIILTQNHTHTKSYAHKIIHSGKS